MKQFACIVIVAALAVGGCERRDDRDDLRVDPDEIQPSTDETRTTPPSTTLPGQTGTTPTQTTPSTGLTPSEPGTAQPGTMQPGMQPGMHHEPGMAMTDQDESAVSLGTPTSVTGVVKKVDLQKGMVTIEKGDETVMIHAKPSQIADLRNGKQFSGQVASIGNEKWLMDDLEKPPSGSKLGRAGSVTGSISTIDKETGMVTIKTQTGESMTLQAHPGELDKLVPGKTMTISFNKLGETSWISQVGESSQPHPDPGV